MLKIRPILQGRRLVSSVSTMRSLTSLRQRAVERVPIPSPMEVHLTDQERQICELLDECAHYLKEQKSISTTCRIAGGWVRDKVRFVASLWAQRYSSYTRLKLLGHDSNDIDIALADMMGLAFAEHLSAFADSKGIEAGTISKIAQNPDQSKHLETATFKLGGLDIDLVNLRSEAYAEDSRIPTEVVRIIYEQRTLSY